MLFFAISGFLICTRLLVEEEAGGVVSLRSFYIRRVFRIIPAAYLYLLVIGVLAATGIITVKWRDLAIPGIFLSNYLVVGSWFTGHFWSLALEEHFYLSWPPLLVRLGRSRAVWIASALVGITVLLRQHTTSGLPPERISRRIRSYVLTLSCFPAFSRSFSARGVAPIASGGS